MPPLFPGRIVRATVPDPQSRNPKSRRCVVVDTLGDSAADPIRLVGVTTTIIEAYPEEYVELQYGPGALTGFTERSAAHCIWVLDIDQSLVEIARGIVRPRFVELILDRIIQLGSRVRVQRIRAVQP